MMLQKWGSNFVLVFYKYVTLRYEVSVTKYVIKFQFSEFSLSRFFLWIFYQEILSHQLINKSVKFYILFV